MRSRIRAVLRQDREAGLGLILIIGVSVFVFTLAMAATAIAVNGIAQSRNRTGFESSLALAETGIDRAMASVQIAYDEMGLDYPIPGPAGATPSPWCVGSTVQFPTSGPGAGGVFATEEEERAWILPRLQALIGTSCMVTDELGQYVVVKPVSADAKYGKVYALAAMPSFADADRTRVVKSEYIFMPFRPQHAILAGGTLRVGGSTEVRSAPGVEPHRAGVHANGPIHPPNSMAGGGNPTITGSVTSASTSPLSTLTSNNFNGGGGVSPSSTVAIPRVDAQKVRAIASEQAQATWFDLCPDGTVRPYAAGAPCPVTTGLPVATSSAINGWTFKASSRTWVASKNVGNFPGTYYAHEANIEAETANGLAPRLTLIASAAQPNDCAQKRYGNIEWRAIDITAPASGAMFMLADTDIRTHSNFSAGQRTPSVISGTFIAGEQMQMETSSQGAVGSVVIGDECKPQSPHGIVQGDSLVQNPAVYFDPNAETPFSSIITTALWLDYGRG